MERKTKRKINMYSRDLITLSNLAMKFQKINLKITNAYIEYCDVEYLI